MRLVYGVVNIGDLNATRIEPQVTLLRQPRRGIGHGLRYRFTFETSFSVSGQIDARTKMDAIEAALALGNKTLIFQNDDGSASTNSSSSTVGAPTLIQNCRCVDWKWMGDAGGQFMSWRKLSGTFEWERHFQVASNFLLDFSEVVTINNPVDSDFVVNEAVNGVAAQLTETVALPKSTATQRGFAEGLTQYPDINIIAPPLWPARLPGGARGPLKPKTSITRTTPDRIGESGTRRFRIEWQYDYESPTALTALPNVWA